MASTIDEQIEELMKDPLEWLKPGRKFLLDRVVREPAMWVGPSYGVRKGPTPEELQSRIDAVNRARGIIA
jgi:hypothetical protein